MVGFFDILGYQSFLENNDDDASTPAIKVLSIINDIGNIISSRLLSAIKEPDDRTKSILNKIKWRAFSDTILMLMEWNKSEMYEWIIFNLAAISLCRHMFDFGLPLRGAIRNGKYMVSESCFAGRAIIEAYRTEKSLQLAACSIDEGLINTVRDEGRNQNHTVTEQTIDVIAVEYMTPLANNQYKKLFLLNYLFPEGDRSKPCSEDIPQASSQQFLGAQERY